MITVNWSNVQQAITVSLDANGDGWVQGGIFIMASLQCTLLHDVLINCNMLWRVGFAQTWKGAWCCVCALYGIAATPLNYTFPPPTSCTSYAWRRKLDEQDFKIYMNSGLGVLTTVSAAGTRRSQG